MNNKNKKLLAIMMIIFQLLLITNISEVIAAEEDEEDNFDILPNYRWNNETSTTGTNEQNLGGYYDIFSSNNETTGTSDFEKSRRLNTNDVDVETKFQIDNGGNESELYRDVLGDPSDFSEDVEGFSGLSSEEVTSGVYIGNCDAVTTEFVTNSGKTAVISPDVYHTLEFTIKSTEQIRITQIFGLLIGTGNVGVYAPDLTLTSTWQTFSLTLTDSWDSGGLFSYFTFAIEDVLSEGDLEGDEIIYIDSFKLIGSLDFATHVEGEVEDTWDWEDSTEFFYDVKDNVSDFNDDTTEDWLAEGNCSISEIDGFLRVAQNGSFNQLTIANYVPAPLIDSAIYTWFTMEFYSFGFISGASLSTIDLLDDGDNVVGTDSTGWGSDASVLRLVSIELNDGNWTGNEGALKVRLTLDATVNDFFLFANFTYIYSTELGDLEGFTGISKMYVDPEGYLASHLPAAASDNLLTPGSLTISTAQFDLVSIRVKSTTPIRIFLQGRDSSNNLDDLDISAFDVTADWSIYTVDLLLDSDWTSDISFQQFELQILDASGEGNLEGDEYLFIDYWLVAGNWSNEDGFKFGLLNELEEESLSCEFNRESYGSYNITMNLYDVSGVSLSYTQEFSYNMINDGWLFLRIELNIPKKKLKLLMEYENGTDIIEIRSLYSLFGLIGRSNLNIFKIGFPSVIINNTVADHGRSRVIIDYIDADWRIMVWKDQGGTTDFKTVSPYEMNYELEDAGSDQSQNYSLLTTKFDGLTFNIQGSQNGADGVGADADISDCIIRIYNVNQNSSLDLIGRLTFRLITTTSGSFSQYVLELFDVSGVETYELVLQTNVPYYNLDAGVGIYNNIEDKQIEFQIKADVGTNGNSKGDMISAAVNRFEDLTKEFLIEIEWKVVTVQDAGALDNYKWRISGFELKRKDFVGELVGSILTPIIGLLALILSPLIFLFQWLVGVLIKAFGSIGVLLEPLFDALGNIMSTITTALSSLADGIFEALFGLVDQFVTFAQDFFADLFGVLQDVIDALVGFVMAAWEDFVNELLIPVITVILNTLGLTELVEFLFGLVVDILTVLPELLELGISYFGFVFASLGFWLQSDRFTSLVYVLITVLAIYILYPLFQLYLLEIDKGASMDDGMEAVELMFSRTLPIFKIFIAISMFVINLLLDVLKLIGNFLPFT